MLAEDGISQDEMQKAIGLTSYCSQAFYGILFGPSEVSKKRIDVTIIDSSGVIEHHTLA